MHLVERSSGRKIQGKIERLIQSEVRSLQNNHRFGFDWSLEAENEVYGIKAQGMDEILGLLSLSDISSEFRIHLNLIESSKENQGKAKQFDNIPGCLIGYACRMAFEKGYDGFVSLLPKTQLIYYYHTTFGFIQVGLQMAVFRDSSQSIIDKYLNDEKI